MDAAILKNQQLQQSDGYRWLNAAVMLLLFKTAIFHQMYLLNINISRHLKTRISAPWSGCSQSIQTRNINSEYLEGA